MSMTNLYQQFIVFKLFTEAYKNNKKAPIRTERCFFIPKTNKYPTLRKILLKTKSEYPHICAY